MGDQGHTDSRSGKSAIRVFSIFLGLREVARLDRAIWIDIVRVSAMVAALNHLQKKERRDEEREGRGIDGEG